MASLDALPEIPGMNAAVTEGTADGALPPLSGLGGTDAAVAGRVTRSQVAKKAPTLVMDDYGSATEDDEEALVTEPSQDSRATASPSKKQKAATRDMAKTVTDGGFASIVATPKLRKPNAELLDLINTNAAASEALRSIVLDMQTGAGSPRRGAGAPGELHDDLALMNGRLESMAAELVAMKRDAPALPVEHIVDMDQFRAKLDNHNAYLVKLGGSVNALNNVVPEQRSRADAMEAELATLKARVAALAAAGALPALPAIEPLATPGRVRPRSPSLDAATAATSSARSKRARGNEATETPRAVETQGASSSASQLYPAISFGPWRSMARSGVTAYNCVVGFINALPDARTLALPFGVSQDSNAHFANAFFESLTQRDLIVEEWTKHTPSKFTDVAALPLSLPTPPSASFVTAAKAAAAGKSAR